MRLKPLLLVLPLLCVAVLLANEISIQNLSMPMFDEAGRLTKTLTADSANGPYAHPILKNGLVTFHTALAEKITPGATLAFEEAVYDKIGAFVEGPGAIRFASASGDLSGVGFHHDLASGRLKLYRDVRALIKGVNIQGQKADALILENPADRAWVITEAIITGPVVATDVVLDKVRFDKVETDRATYSRADGTLTLASPVTGWIKGEKTVLGGQLIQIKTGEPAPAPAVPAPAPLHP
ncbi:MAG: hypothetical protein H7067_00355 [Burkholderiales bacterium]|nr:hypothetical protein [Opitutaceae bacterium]